jgi:hypothetical protein
MFFNATLGGCVLFCAAVFKSEITLCSHKTELFRKLNMALNNEYILTRQGLDVICFKTPFVPRSKHTPSRLYKPVS